MAGASVITTLVCPVIGLVITMFMWLSPLPAVWKARLSREIGSLNPLPFVVMIINCLGWILYSCLTKDIFVFLGNISGLALGLFYTLSCLPLVAKKSAVEEFSSQYLLVEGLLIFGFSFWALMAYFCVTIFTSSPDPQKEATVMVGLLSCACSVSYYAAPLSTMASVISNRDSSSLFLPLICINWINALLWFCYGAFGVGDINIAVPNGLGVVLASCQILLVFLFKRGTFWEALTGTATSGPRPIPLDSTRSTSAIKMPHTTADDVYETEEEWN